MLSPGSFSPAPSVTIGQRARRTAILSAVVGAAVALPSSATAQAASPSSTDAPEQVELTFVGGAGCPSRTAFVKQVAARIRRPIEWVAAEASTRIVVTVGAVDGSATGQLEVVRHDAEPTRREFVASSCSEVSSALALVTALTLDPNARTEQLPPLAASADMMADPEPVAPAALPPPAAEPPPPPPPPPSATQRQTAPVGRAAKAPARYVFWIGPSAGVANGYAPEPLVALGATLGARAAVRRGFSPSFQLSPLWGKTGSTGPSASLGTFAWAMARLEACPASLALAAQLTLEPCVAAELGRLSARGADGQVNEPVAVERWWAAAGATLSLHFSAARWFTRLGTQILFPATRDEFVFRDPDQMVHRAGPLVYGANLGLGFQLGE